MIPKLNSKTLSKDLPAIHKLFRTIGSFSALLAKERPNWMHVGFKVNQKSISTDYFSKSAGEKVVIEPRKLIIKFISANGKENKLHLTPTISSIEIFEFIASKVNKECELPPLTNHTLAPLGINTELFIDIFEAVSFMQQIFTQLENKFGIEQSTIKLWPHHLDLAFNWYNPNDIEQLIYHGFSLGDETIQMPYLATYIHPWPKDFLPRVKKPQYYNDKEWRGIVLNYSDIKTSEEVVDFFTTHHEQLLSTI
ncbi:hypothetical protein KC909_03830 [Candidatus Dojkabacteria bacterium]|uniref:Uncharacterized protein n=1 Tax=Candidatus Dojkabacteria bacterium TaxID=2099670 RepID=A0A955L5K6_9BACT|nr:hypothetical protein [Candidatus Dojkabacteria bacterium]